MRGFTLYLDEVGKYRLTPDQEIDLANRAKLGDIQARNELILSKVRLVVSIAKKFSHNGNLEDLVQEGTLGLFEAVKEYNPNSDNSFGTYAYYWIRHYISRFLEKDETVRGSEKIQLLRRRIFEIMDDYFLQIGSVPSIQEIVDKLNEKGKKKYSLKTVEGALKYSNPQMISLDTKEGNNFEYTTLDEGENPEQIAVRHDAQEKVREAVGELSPKLQDALRLRFGLSDGINRSQYETSLYLNISESGARKRETIGLRKLRENPYVSSLN